jgi:hypothetical protein
MLTLRLDTFRYPPLAPRPILYAPKLLLCTAAHVTKELDKNVAPP